jgi:endonuclease/exonuclease/phosphatase family metal-dependent hydrolase
MRVPWRAVLAILLFGQASMLGAERLRVLTVNVWSGLDYKGSLRMGWYEDAERRALRTRVLLEQLRTLAPDVVALNEANKLPRYARELARALGYDCVYHVGLGGLRVGAVGLPVNLREGDVILAAGSRELSGAGRSQLSGGPVGNIFTLHFSDATQVVAASILAGGRRLYVFNTHWHASPAPTREYLEQLSGRLKAGLISAEDYEKLRAEAEEGQQWRLGEARRTLEFIQRVAGDDPVILMGDFNAESSSQEIALLRRAGLVDAWAAVGKGPGYSWDGTVNGNIQLQKQRYPQDFWLEPKRSRIDYVFLRGQGLKALRAEVVLNRPLQGVYPSDHFGVLVEIEVPEP